MNLIKHLAIVTAVALTPAFALAQTAPATGTGATTPPAAQAKGERKGPKGGERGERFKQADTNGDGAISKAEFEAANAKRSAAMFDRLDANKDGKVTREEMKAARSEHKGRHHGDKGGKRGPATTPAAPAAPATK